MAMEAPFDRLLSVHETAMLFLKPDLTKKNRELFFQKDLYGVIRA